MIGFEIELNGTTTKGAVENGIVFINISRNKAVDKDEIDMHFEGFDSDSNQRLQWMMKNLKVDDRIIIRVTEVDSPSKPEVIEHLDLTSSLIEGKLRAYQALKRELEARGLI